MAVCYVSSSAKLPMICEPLYTATMFLHEQADTTPRGPEQALTPARFQTSHIISISSHPNQSIMKPATIVLLALVALVAVNGSQVLQEQVGNATKLDPALKNMLSTTVY